MYNILYNITFLKVHCKDLWSISITQHYKNQNLNKRSIRGKNGGEHA